MARTTLDGKVVMVTGAASGLGEAISRAFAREGCKVALLDVNDERLAQVARSTEAPEGAVTTFRCDVSKEEDVFGAVAKITEQWGRLDIVVNNAAIDHTMSIDEMSVAQWDQVVGVNLRGPFLTIKASAPHMRKVGGGHIVNIASTAALRQWANASAYHASKSGLVALGRAFGVEGRPDNIRVTTVLPGGMRTHFFDRFEEQGIPMPEMENLQDPAHVADVVVFAVSMPAGSALQEVLVTPPTETSWP